MKRKIMSQRQEEAIELLKDLGADESRLWLIEVQGIDSAKELYKERYIDDLVQFKDENDDSIIYYHESGTIQQHATFNREDHESFKEAVKWLAEFLGVDLTRCPECNSYDIEKGEVVEVETSSEYNICNNCGHRWNQNSIFI